MRSIERLSESLIGMTDIDYETAYNTWELVYEYLQSDKTIEIEATRLLLFLVTKARGNLTHRYLETHFANLLINFERSVEEYIFVGRSLTKLLEVLAIEGPEVIEDCTIDWPGDASSRFRQPMQISSAKSLFELTIFWCNVLPSSIVHFSKYSSFLAEEIVDIVSSFNRLLRPTDCQLPTLNAICCALLVVLHHYAEVVTYEQGLGVGQGVLGWVDFALERIVLQFDSEEKELIGYGAQRQLSKSFVLLTAGLLSLLVCASQGSEQGLLVEVLLSDLLVLMRKYLVLNQTRLKAASSTSLVRTQVELQGGKQDLREAFFSAEEIVSLAGIKFWKLLFDFFACIPEEKLGSLLTGLSLPDGESLFQLLGRCVFDIQSQDYFVKMVGLGFKASVKMNPGLLSVWDGSHGSLTCDHEDSSNQYSNNKLNKRMRQESNFHDFSQEGAMNINRGDFDPLENERFKTFSTDYIRRILEDDFSDLGSLLRAADTTGLHRELLRLVWKNSLTLDEPNEQFKNLESLNEKTYLLDFLQTILPVESLLSFSINPTSQGSILKLVQHNYLSFSRSLLALQEEPEKPINGVLNRASTSTSGSITTVKKSSIPGHKVNQTVFRGTLMLLFSVFRQRERQLFDLEVVFKILWNTVDIVTLSFPNQLIESTVNSGVSKENLLLLTSRVNGVEPKFKLNDFLLNQLEDLTASVMGRTQNNGSFKDYKEALAGRLEFQTEGFYLLIWLHAASSLYLVRENINNEKMSSDGPITGKKRNRPEGTEGEIRSFRFLFLENDFPFLLQQLGYEAEIIALSVDSTCRLVQGQLQLHRGFCSFFHEGGENVSEIVGLLNFITGFCRRVEKNVPQIVLAAISKILVIVLVSVDLCYTREQEEIKTLNQFHSMINHTLKLDDPDLTTLATVSPCTLLQRAYLSEQVSHWHREIQDTDETTENSNNPQISSLLVSPLQAFFCAVVPLFEGFVEAVAGSGFGARKPTEESESESDPFFGQSPFPSVEANFKATNALSEEEGRLKKESPAWVEVGLSLLSTVCVLGCVLELNQDFNVGLKDSSKEGFKEWIGGLQRVGDGLVGKVLKLVKSLHVFPEIRHMERFGQLLSVCLFFEEITSPLVSERLNLGTRRETAVWRGFVDLINLKISPKSFDAKLGFKGLFGFLRSCAIISPERALKALNMMLDSVFRHKEDSLTNQFDEEIAFLAADGILQHLLLTEENSPEPSLEPSSGPSLDYSPPDRRLSFLFKLFQAEATEQPTGLAIARTLNHVLAIPGGHSFTQEAIPGLIPYIFHHPDEYMRGLLIARLGKFDFGQKDLISAPVVLSNLLTFSGFEDKYRTPVSMLREVLPLETAKWRAGLNLKSNSEGNYHTTSFGAVIKRFMWDLGGGETKKRRALKALKTISFIFVQRTWEVGNSLSDEDILKGFENNTSEALSQVFLFLMSNLYTQNWYTEQTQDQQEQSLKSLSALIQLLSAIDVAKFLPKIMTLIDTALGGTSARVQHAAVELTAKVSECLPLDALQQHFPTLVVALFPLLEQNPVGDKTQSKTQVSTLRTLAGSDLHFLGKRGGTGGPQSLLIPPCLSRGAPFPRDPTLAGMFSTLLSHRLDRRHKEEARTLAAQLVTRLFVDRRGDFEACFRSVAYLPRTPELEVAGRFHQKAVRGMRMEETLEVLRSMVSHESLQVRLVALSRLTVVCRDKKPQLIGLMRREAEAPFGPLSPEDAVVAQLVRELLLLAGREKSPKVLEACGRCLGEIGAIDPARLHLRKLAPRNTFSLLSPAVNPPKPTPSPSEPKSQYQTPWLLDAPIEVTLFVAERHLVPALKSAPDSIQQDKSGFALQHVLQFLAKCENANPVPDQLQVKQSSEDTQMYLASPGVRALLAARQIDEITEAYWTTRYVLDEKVSNRNPPFFSENMSGVRWIGLLTRYLIQQSRGPLKALFEAVRTIVRTDVELCQFLLPFLVVDCLTQAESAEELEKFEKNENMEEIGINTEPLKNKKKQISVLKHSREQILNGILTEISAVLMDCCSSDHITLESGSLSGFNPKKVGFSSSNGKQVAVQTVFVLFDVLGLWASEARRLVRLEQREKEKEKIKLLNQQINSVSSNTTSTTVEKDKRTIETVISCLHQVSLETVDRVIEEFLTAARKKAPLSEAALSCGALARSLRYLETHCREDFRGKKRTPPEDNFLVSDPRGRPEARRPANTSTTTVSDHSLFAEPVAEVAEGYSSNRAKCLDGALGQLPVLNQVQLQQTISIYAKLEDVDSFQGCLVKSQIHQQPNETNKNKNENNGLNEDSSRELEGNNTYNRILELEQTADWMGALLEYGLLQNSRRFLKSVENLSSDYDQQINPMLNQTSSGNPLQYHTSPGLGGTSVSSTASYQNRNKNNLNSKNDENIPNRDLEATLVPTNTFNSNRQENEMVLLEKERDLPLMSLSEIAELEKGRLRCLMELGHFETVISQSTGLSERMKKIENQFLPLGVEASWRLMQWEDLSSFLTQNDQLNSNPRFTNPNPNSPFIPSLFKTQTTRNTQNPTSYSAPSSFNKTQISQINPDFGGEESILPLAENDLFQLRVGKLLLGLQKREKESFWEDLKIARIETMSSLSTASMESYDRAYPFLVKLHLLHEIEQGWELIHLPNRNEDSFFRAFSTGSTFDSNNWGNNVNRVLSDFDSKREREKRLNTFQWEERLGFLADSVNIQRSSLLAVRRTILSLCGLNEHVAANWLDLSQSLRKQGKFDSARIAIRSGAVGSNFCAEGVGLARETVLLQECRIMRDSGEINRALLLLEPSPIEVVSIIKTLKNRKTQKLPEFIDTKEKQIRLAERLQLSTQLMVQSQLKQGSSIVERYKAIISLNPHSAQAYFDLARYYEFLYNEIKAKNMSEFKNSNNSNISNIGKNTKSSRKSVGEMENDPNKPVFTYFIKAMEQYCKCLLVSDDPTLATQTLPRLLSLWLSFTSLQDFDFALDSNSTLHRTQSSGRKTGLLDSIVDTANKLMEQSLKELPASTWFSCLPQLVSRVLHRNTHTVDIIVKLICKILSNFPKQGIWQISGLMNSMNSDRKQIAKRVFKEISPVISKNNPNDLKMLKDSQKFFSQLILLASHPAKERQIRWNWDLGIIFENFLLPVQNVLNNCNSVLEPLKTQTTLTEKNSYLKTDDQFLMRKIYSEVEVKHSKAKPKVIQFCTVSGKKVKFLCKQEKEGDLRKDARLMEFNTVINRLLQNQADSRRRNLRLRTYAVICLHEECGILEWINNTDCLRQLIVSSHNTHPDLFPQIPIKTIHPLFVENQTTNDHDIPKLADNYLRLLESFEYSPCLHQWFLERFKDPTEWLESRVAFIRSSAVWSAVGHVVGLGDRHTENILVDTTNGEVAHVDFDCLFDKGLSLARPEIVPFRLTPNMIDAFGPNGVEGIFRKTLELMLSVLRENRDVLLSVIEPFLQDPTVAWSRDGRAQREELNRNNSVHSDTTGISKKSGYESENKEAKRMLRKISERLEGIYNIIHPHKDRIINKLMQSGRNTFPSVGLGAAFEEPLPLSVPGQTQKLIDEAIAVENLGQMYIGWQPWA